MEVATHNTLKSEPSPCSYACLFKNKTPKCYTCLYAITNLGLPYLEPPSLAFTYHITHNQHGDEMAIILGQNPGLGIFVINECQFYHPWFIFIVFNQQQKISTLQTTSRLLLLIICYGVFKRQVKDFQLKLTAVHMSISTPSTK